jgi:hypothetical protein
MSESPKYLEMTVFEMHAASTRRHEATVSGPDLKATCTGCERSLALKKYQYLESQSNSSNAYHCSSMALVFEAVETCRSIKDRSASMS